MITKVKEFKESINFNSVTNSMKYLDILINEDYAKILLNFYKTSEEPKKKEKYQIYPNDYTTTNLQKSFYYLEVNNDSIGYMLESFA